MLGSSCSIPRPGRASSAYLLESPKAAIVADFGTGAFANLTRFRGADTLDAIIISHMHADHFIDVIPLRYALRYGGRTQDRRVPLFLPPGGEAILRGVVAPFTGEGGSFLDDVFAIRNYSADEPLVIGDVTVRFGATTHYIPCFAMRFEMGGTSLAYSGDTAPDDGVVEFVRDCDTLLCEATLRTQEESVEPRGHLSAREAGLIASHANARELILTHYPASFEPNDMLRDAASVYSGPIRVVDDGERLSL